jgi:hypothetical protein
METTKNRAGRYWTESPARSNRRLAFWGTRLLGSQGQVLKNQAATATKGRKD